MFAVNNQFADGSPEAWLAALHLEVQSVHLCQFPTLESLPPGNEKQESSQPNGHWASHKEAFITFSCINIYKYIQIIDIRSFNEMQLQPKTLWRKWRQLMSAGFLCSKTRNVTTSNQHGFKSYLTLKHFELLSRARCGRNDLFSSSLAMLKNVKLIWFQHQTGAAAFTVCQQIAHNIIPSPLFPWLKKKCHPSQWMLKTSYVDFE